MDSHQRLPNEPSQARPEYHPLAEIFPLIEGYEFAGLVDDIRTHGLREPIALYQGRVLDGRNRYRACEAAGVAPRFEDYTGDDPVGYVISLNLRRRHLDESQRAMVAAKLATMRQGERTDLKPSANLQKVAQAGAAKLLNISARTVASAANVRAAGAPELVSAVERGDVSVSAAADVATMPQDEQREIVGRGKKEIVAAAKQIRQQKKKRHRGRPLELPKQNEHERDLEFLESAWASACESARAAFADDNRLAARESDIESEITWEEEEVIDLVEEVLDGEPLSAKQAATLDKIKKRLRRRAREAAKREAANAQSIRKYGATLGPFVTRLIDAGVARDLWQALTVRGPCGAKEGYALWLVPPLVEAIEDALCADLYEGENTPPVGADNMRAPIVAPDDGLDIPECLKR
jgi:hypothetical protein